MSETRGARPVHYAALMRIPGARWFVVSSLLARLPIAMGSLAFLLYVQRTTGTFGDSGLVSGSVLLGVASGTVVQGRLVDVFGARRTLAPVLVLFGLVAALNFWAIEARAHVGILIACAFFFGATEPAVSPASRAVWAKTAPGGRVLEAALTYEAISLEVFFILGPAIAGVLAASEWPGTGLLATVVLLIIGTLLFISSPLVGKTGRMESPGAGRLAERQRAREHSRGLLRNSGMHTLVLLAAGFGVLAGAVEVVAPAVAVAAGHRELGGVLLAGWSLTSVVFGLLYSLWPWPLTLERRAPMLLGAFALLVAAMAIPQTLAGFTVAVLVAGLLITPQATTQSLLVDRVAPREASGGAFAWVVTAVTLGLGVGQGAAGALFAAFGPRAALLIPAAAGLALTIVAWRGRHTLSPSPSSEASPALTPPEHRTLYVTDLDGTLLNSAGELSEESRETLRSLIEQRGLQLSYATARSYESAHPIVAELGITLPVAVYGGALIVDGGTGEVLLNHALAPDVVQRVFDVCRGHALQPLVYDFHNGLDRVMWLQGQESAGIRNYLATRKHDRRLSPAHSWVSLASEATFYITIIGELAAITAAARAVRNDLSDRASITVQRDTYFPDEYWLEISAPQANKADAIRELSRRTNSDRVVCFGDNNNDLPMFALADESFAVANANETVRAAANGIIERNDDAAVARTIERMFNAVPRQFGPPAV